MIENRKRVFFLILLICGWLTMLFIESSQAPAEIMGRVPGLDKVAHFFAFGILSLLVCALSFNLSNKPKIPILSFPLLIVSLSGAMEESFQTLIPGRIASLEDLLADVVGALFAIVLANRIALLSRKNSRLST